MIVQKKKVKCRISGDFNLLRIIYYLISVTFQMLGQENDKSKRELHSGASCEKIKFWECLLLFILASSIRDISSS
jgi:hypothetical protein